MAAGNIQPRNGESYNDAADRAAAAQRAAYEAQQKAAKAAKK